MATINNGVVASVSTKDVTTKFGTKKTYSFKLTGGDWYKTGFKDPKISEGDVVSFEYTEGTYGKDCDITTIKKTSGSFAASGGVADAPRPSYGSKGVFPIPALDGQRAIIRQNALTNARELYQQGKKEVTMDNATASSIIAMARMFEAYTAGDLDMAEAMADMVMDA